MAGWAGKGEVKAVVGNNNYCYLSKIRDAVGLHPAWGGHCPTHAVGIISLIPMQPQDSCSLNIAGASASVPGRAEWSPMDRGVGVSPS